MRSQPLSNRWRSVAVSVSFVLGLGARAILAEPALFEDVSSAVGMQHTGPTYGASWGDLNSDGWPDLWVGNHNQAPSLYLNIGGASLKDVAPRVWSGNPAADAHGAAWADFDNDGDQDLVEVVAATITDGEMCVGCGTNHLYVNQSGRLVESARAYGLDQPGLARSPLWFDADDDGRLDLFVNNLRRPDHPRSVLMLNKPSGFVAKSRGTHDRNPDRRLNRYRKWMSNLFRGNLSEPKQIHGKTHHGFAQLADLTGDGKPDLVNHSRPLRVFSRSGFKFADTSLQLGFPELRDTGDAAIADFDGDGDMDIYITVGPYRLSQVEQPDQNRLHTTILGHNLKNDPAGGKAISFQTAGDLTLLLAPEWLDLDDVLLGSSGRHPTSYTLSFDRAAASELGVVNPSRLADGAVGIGFDSIRNRWIIANRLRAEFIDVVASSTAPITNVESSGFESFVERGRDALLLATGSTFEVKELAGAAGEPTSCHSVAAADFDNDMDVDIYLACSESVRNRPDRLLLNDGAGNFVAVAPVAESQSVGGRGDVAVAADYNRDGFVDLFVANGSDPASPLVADGPHQLLRNKGNANHWLQLDLQGTKSNRDGIGARVVIEAGGRIQVREQNGGMHRFAQDYQRLHFGIGANTAVDKITVAWPSGINQTLLDVDADQILTIVEGDSK